MNELSALLLYLSGANIIALIMMGIDKQKAKKQQWRIPERTFWSLAIIGGAFGVLIGMRTFRHKTKHRSFVVGIPLLLLLHIVLLFIYFSMS